MIFSGVIKNPEVAKIMEKIDRKHYSPYPPYEDSPQPIGYGATISAPHMHAYALELLYNKLVTAKTALDVGSGTGYLTAAMALIMPPEGKVYGVEHVPELVKKSIENIQNDSPELLKKIKIETGDGRMGWTIDKGLTFDVIHVGAAAEKTPPALVEQLAEGGIMIIPVGGRH